MYAEDGAIPSVKPAFSDDLYLGRIMAKIVAPPHTAGSLKHCLSSIENIDDNISTSLFVSASSQAPMDDAGRLPELGHSGPGCTPGEPMALVAMISDHGRRSLDELRPETVLLPLQDGPTPFEAQYRKHHLPGLFTALTSDLSLLLCL